MTTLSNVFLILITIFYAATWLIDLPKLKKANGKEKAIYYTLALSVAGLYLCSILQIDVVLPTRWVVYTWSDWLHGMLST